MSKDYKVVNAVSGFTDFTETIAAYSARGWDVHTFTVVKHPEDLTHVMYVLLVRRGLPGHTHLEDSDEG